MMTKFCRANDEKTGEKKIGGRKSFTPHRSHLNEIKRGGVPDWTDRGEHNRFSRTELNKIKTK